MNEHRASEHRAPVQLARVHGSDAQAVGGQSLGRLHGVSLLLDVGVHAFVGTPQDGTAALCELLSGRRPTRVGAIEVAGRDPAKSAWARRHIGVLLPRPTLPPGGLAGDVVERLAGVLSPALSGALERVGAGSLAAREVAALSVPEARAVELALALSLPAPVLLVLYDPFGEVAAVDDAAVRGLMSQRAAEGSVVVVATSAPGDVEGLADHLHVLERGRLVTQSQGWPHRGGRELFIWLEGDDEAAARRFAAALHARPELSAVSWRRPSDGGAALVAVRADTLDDAALSVAETVAELGVRVGAIHTDAPALAALQGAMASPPATGEAGP
jgi:ABC-2 type transport system ATP-binding protein